MSVFRNQRITRGISLLIKILILLACFFYIYKKMVESPASLDLNRLFSRSNSSSMILLFLLMFVNWGIEAMKWKILIRPLEEISFVQAWNGVLAGVTLSIFSPNRVGEFAARVFLLEKADRLQASLLSMIGSFFQLLVTFVAGLLAFLILERSYHDFFRLDPQFPGIENWIGMAVSAFFLLLIVLYRVLRKRLPSFLQRPLKVIHLLKNSEINAVWVLSVIRYVVFTIQYILVLNIMGITAGTTILVCLIALTFFFTSAIPTFAVTEIAVRGAAATWFIGSIYSDSNAIVAASFLLWIINLAIPALWGAFTVHRFNFFKGK